MEMGTVLTVLTMVGGVIIGIMIYYGISAMVTAWDRRKKKKKDPFKNFKKEATQYETTVGTVNVSPDEAYHYIMVKRDVHKRWKKRKKENA